MEHRQDVERSRRRAAVQYHQPVRRALCRLFRRLARLEQLAVRPDRPAARGERVAHPRLLSRGERKKGAREATPATLSFDGFRLVADLCFIVTLDLIRGPFTQRGKNGSRIKSGMTNVRNQPIAASYIVIPAKVGTRACVG
ncbi:protein of unknown function [uncultured Sphingopyxis sp.]|uniref:Uncharacterized protein n=1 Tax=uncultured Sphingopyxis sp. TaxID=310581 RepID=A0A1Y5PMH4_9SPHN|nr:protein of unknown function [uncultured Sphingopyxis sp.]